MVPVVISMLNVHLYQNMVLCDDQPYMHPTILDMLSSFFSGDDSLAAQHQARFTSTDPTDPSKEVPPAMVSLVSSVVYPFSLIEGTSRSDMSPHRSTSVLKSTTVGSTRKAEWMMIISKTSIGLILTRLQTYEPIAPACITS